MKTRSTRFRRRTKRAAKSLRSKRLISQCCEVGFQLAVFSFQHVVNIGKLQEKFHSTVQNGCEIISQQMGDFATLCKILPSAWSDRLAMAVTSSFQLQIVHHLKHWIFNFLSFETKYSMHKLDFRKCSKSGCHDCHQECFMEDFSLLPLLAFRIFLWQRTSKLWFFMFLSFPLLCYGFQITLLNLILLW